MQKARVFKIPGVRRLVKTHGPTATFTKRSAIQLIAKKDPANPDAKFEDYQNLYLEQRDVGTKLDVNEVFLFLIKNKLYRMGKDLKCPTCNMISWVALDVLKQYTKCELCGDWYDATQQLVHEEWDYRRSGVLGVEKNVQGAVPVVLTLQQLDANLRIGTTAGMYSPSLNLDPIDGRELPKCEVDFVWVIPRQYPGRTVVILGECKDKAKETLNDEKIINNLRLVADALPAHRFKTFVLLTKLSPFTSEEIAQAKTLNVNGKRRVILLTEQELEPYHIYERKREGVEIPSGSGGTPESLADVTAQIYFDAPLH